MSQKLFWRVCNTKTKQGLWYDFNGTFTGLIHDRFKFCMNSTLKMDFDDELVGYLSATDVYDDLFKWFSKEDILKLQARGWFIHEYTTEDYKFYDRFQHYVINQNNSKLVKKIILPYPQKESVDDSDTYYDNYVDGKGF